MSDPAAGTAAPPVRRTSYRELLANRRFILYTLSSTAAATGYSVYAISIPWLALDVSKSLFLVGLVLFAEFGVYTLTFLVAPWVDRAGNKRTIFLLCYPVQAVAAAGIGIGLADHALGPGLLLALVVVISFLWDFAWAANNIVPRLLLPSDQLFRAEGLRGLLSGLTQLGGNAVGAALVVLVSPSGGMFLYAALLAVGTGFAALVSLPQASAVARAPARFWSEFREGWQYFGRRTRGSLFSLGLVELVQGLFAAAPTLLITAIAFRVLSGSSAAYTTLFVAWVVGGVIVGLALGELNPRGRIGAILLVSLVAQGALVLAALAVAPHLLFGAILWLLIGGAASAYVSAKYVFLQGAFPPEALGRITSNLYLFTGISSAVGALALGEVATSWSPVAFGALVGVGFLLAGAMVLATPAIRRLTF